MMKIRFLDVAQIELDEAVDYYTLELPGLGEQFLAEVIKAIERIEQFPTALPSFTKNTRRCQIQRFPYAIIYQILESEILIVAIAHLHRKPGYWKSRI